MAERKARLAGLQLELSAQVAQLDAEVAAGVLISALGELCCSATAASCFTQQAPRSQGLRRLPPAPPLPACSTGAAIQKRIAERERQIKAHYDTFHAGQAAAADAEDALDLMANSLGAAEDEAQRGAAACGHLRAELERRRAAVEVAQGKLEAARVRLALEGQQLGSLQQKVGGLARGRRVGRRRWNAGP